MAGSGSTACSCIICSMIVVGLHEWVRGNLGHGDEHEDGDVLVRQ